MAIYKATLKVFDKMIYEKTSALLETFSFLHTTMPVIPTMSI